MFKYSMLFNFQGQGFSESWYTTAGTLLGTSGSLNPPFLPLAIARANMTGKYVLLVGVRLTDLSNPRNTQTYAFAQKAQAGDDPDNVTNSFLVNVRGAANVGNRSLFIRGLPDDAIVWNDAAQVFSPVGVMVRQFSAYRNALLNDGWQLRAVQPIAKPIPAGQLISAITNNPVTDAVVITTSAAMPNQTLPLLVSGFKKPLSFLNGTYQPNSGFTITSGSSVTLRNRAMTLPQSLTFVSGSAAVRTQNFAFVNVNRVTIEFPRERRTGRAFFVPAGRRRAR